MVVEPGRTAGMGKVHRRGEGNTVLVKPQVCNKYRSNRTSRFKIKRKGGQIFLASEKQKVIKSENQKIVAKERSIFIKVVVLDERGPQHMGKVQGQGQGVALLEGE